MTPRVDGRILHFETRGLYDGLSILWDRETGSLWNHITGEAVYGELQGKEMPVSNLLHLTVKETLAAYPDIHVAISDRPIRRRRSRVIDRVPVLRRLFRNTIAEEDTRRPTMDIGLGIWIGGQARYYPMEYVTASDNVVIDLFGGRRVLVYFAPHARAILSIYTEATSARWDGEELHLDTGEVLREGVLYDTAGNRRDFERPLQVFTRWYGFALTFPGTEIYEP